MKKIFAIISAIAVFASCNKEAGQNDPVKPEVKLVPISVSAGVDTKATIGEMKWEEGDKITVWVKSDVDTNPSFQGYELEIVDLETGEFHGEIVEPQETDTYYAAYGAAGFDAVNHVPYFAIPAVQNEAAEGATKVLLKGMCSNTDKKNISFAMTAATAKLSITVDQAVTGVEFAGMNNELIAKDGATTISYSGEPATDIQFIVPAINFTKGYKLTYTNASGKMYQSYASSGTTFAEASERKVNCAFVPFSISCAVDAANAPKTSYDYYLAGDIATANSEAFETVGRLSGQQGEQPWEYDEDAKGIFTGRIQKGKAQVVISGMSSSLIPSNLKITEYGCKIQHVGGQSGTDVYATGQSIALTKDFKWDIMYKLADPTDMLTADAGDYEIKPYIKVTDGSSETEYVAPTAYTLHITGLPHKSDHKDLWYVNPSTVSGKVVRHPDTTEYPVDMFEMPNDARGEWRDFAARTKYFNIPAATKAQVNMYGQVWAPNSIYAYFWFDATKDGFVLHKDAPKSGSELEDPAHNCDAYDEESDPDEGYYYLGAGANSVLNDNTITLTPENPAASVYLWIHRGTTVSTWSYVGYWCRFIKVQYAPAN